MGVELGTQGLATSIASRSVRGRVFDLDVFGGVMFTTNEHEDINTVADLKDKVIGAQVISNFGSAQIQFFVMKENGLDYIMDPKQVIFYSKFSPSATA
jgi:ABC-type nitrate/sulfonate/bicarbonate transport system substrate-binding protein